MQSLIDAETNRLTGNRDWTTMTSFMLELVKGTSDGSSVTTILKKQKVPVRRSLLALSEASMAKVETLIETLKQLSSVAGVDAMTKIASAFGYSPFGLRFVPKVTKLSTTLFKIEAAGTQKPTALKSF